MVLCLLHRCPTQVMGIAGVDTRAITRRLRVTGCLNGAITTDPSISGAQAGCDDRCSLQEAARRGCCQRSTLFYCARVAVPQMLGQLVQGQARGNTCRLLCCAVQMRSCCSAASRGRLWART